MLKDFEKQEISLADMRLLVTAVISFNSEEIVSAVLNVKKLRCALSDIFSKNDKGGRGGSSSTTDGERACEEMMKMQTETMGNEQVPAELDTAQSGDNPLVSESTVLPETTQSGDPNHIPTTHNKRPHDLGTDLTCQPQAATDSSLTSQSSASSSNEGGGIHRPPDTNTTPPPKEAAHSESQGAANQDDQTGMSDKSNSHCTETENNGSCPTMTSHSSGSTVQNVPSSSASAISSKSKLNKIDELLRKQVLQDSLLPNPSSFSSNEHIFEQVSDVISHPSKPLNLSMNRSRKRKNSSPKHVPNHLLTSISSHSPSPGPAVCHSTDQQLISITSQAETYLNRINAITASTALTMTPAEYLSANLNLAAAAAAMRQCDTSLTGPFITPNLSQLDMFNAASGAGIFSQRSQLPTTNTFDSMEELDSGFYYDAEQDNSLDISGTLVLPPGDVVPLHVYSNGKGSGKELNSGEPIDRTKKRKSRKETSSKDVQKSPTSGSLDPLQDQKKKTSSDSGNLENQATGSGQSSPTGSTSSGNNIPLRLRCRRCNERFNTKCDYQQHLQSQVCSTGYTQTHKCQVCGYCALTRQRLIVHMRTHSGERPHRCPFCSYAATQTAPLKRHIQNIHMKQGAISLST